GVLPPRARQADVGPLRHGALRGEPAQGARPDPRDPPGVLDQPEGVRRLALLQPDPRAGGPGRRLHRTRRADVHRRPAPQRELRRPLPRREPDPRGRGAARRRELRLRGRLGVDAGERASGPAPRSPRVRVRPPRPAELQVTATREGAGRTSIGAPTEKRGMNLTLRIWRQKDPSVKGKMVTYKVSDISPDMSFLEMLDVLNEQLIMQGDDPVAFDHDCREGICGMCGVMINGQAH